MTKIRAFLVSGGTICNLLLWGCCPNILMTTTTTTMAQTQFLLYVFFPFTFFVSGLIGDDDLWYNCIPGTVRSLSFFFAILLQASQLALLGGSKALLAGFSVLQASSETLTAYSRAHSAGS